MARPRVPEERVDRLFQGPLEEFTEARNQLAKELRGEGKKAAADEVKALRKPTLAAWLVNQLAERKPKEVEELLATGRELRRRQEEMLAGSTDQEALRRAARREQQGIDSLLKTAAAIGEERGVSSQILDRVGETLQAAASDPELSGAIRRGRVSRERRASSIGLVGDATAAPPKHGRSKAKAGSDDAAERRARQETAKRRKEAERKLAAAEKKLERERAGFKRAREAAMEAAEKVELAERDVKSAQRGLRETD